MGEIAADPVWAVEEHAYFDLDAVRVWHRASRVYSVVSMVGLDDIGRLAAIAEAKAVILDALASGGPIHEVEGEWL